VRINLSAYLFFCCILCRLCGFAQTTSDAAVTYQINVKHTGAKATPGVSPPLTIQWSKDLGATVGYPLIAGGKVFVIAGDSSMGKVDLYSLDLLTGTTLWGPILIPQDAYWWAAAAYDNGKVFVVPNTTSGVSNGVMYAFDANTGTALWTTILPGQYFFTAPPAALNGIVYTSGAGGGGTVYAVRESDGTVLWTAGVANGDNSSPVVTGTGVYVSYVCPQTYKFAPRTGALIWHYSGPCEGGGGATPVLYNGLLYVRDWSSSLGHNGDILNATTGAVVGSFDASFIPAFINKTAFYVQASGIKAVNTTSGTNVWNAVPPSGSSYSTPPIVVDGVVYVGTDAGKLLGYRSATGKNVVSVDMGSPISAAETGSVGSPESGLAAADGFLLVPASTHLVALHH
jgi:outer membrane protein assembly factor BamB